MCSRFFRETLTWPDYAQLAGVSPLDGVAPPPANWNAAPGVHHPIIRRGAHTALRELAPCYWGLVPSWWTKPIRERKFTGISVDMSEAPHRPVYRGAYRYRRCLVPVTGFYIWTGSAKARTPFAVSLSVESAPFCLAGLWDSALIDGSVLESFAVLTTTPNDALAGLTHTMPVILKPQEYNRWLDGAEDERDARFEPVGPADIRVWPADPMVGNVRNNHPDLVNRSGA